TLFRSPAPVAALEEVRRLHVCLDLAVAVAAVDVLGEDDPGEVAAHLRLHPRQREAHLERAREDALPALHHRAPADEEPPARMDALDVRCAEPDLLHALRVEVLEGGVEGGVGLEDGVAVGHDGLGAMTTSSAIRSGPGLRTACSSPAGAHARSPGRTSRSSPPTRMRPVPEST